MSLRPTCGGCAWFQVNPQDVKRGSCNHGPPVVVAVGTQRGPLGMTMRPDVAAGDVACNKHMVRPPDHAGAPRIVGRT